MRTHPPAHGPPERGAALLVAMVAVAVLTALAVSLAYETRVSLRIAANARDELRASYLARSGVTLSRLVLSFQQSVDKVLGSNPGPIPRLQVWQLLPVGTDLTRSLFPASAAVAGGAAPESGFDAKIDNEDRKVNVQFNGDTKSASSIRLAMQLQALYELVCDTRWDPLFDREDANGVRTSREELLVHLRDWVDEDDRPSALRASSGGPTCSTMILPQPFEEGYGDENLPYDRGEDRYRVKNARLDSLDELFLVAGVSDGFMAAFGDDLTVYLENDAKRNVNELDRRKLVQLAQLVADPPMQPALLDPVFAERLQALVIERTLGGILALRPEELGQLIQDAGVMVNTGLLQAGPNSPFTSQSTTFRVRATGKAGAVSSAIDAVIRLESTAQGQPVAAPGRLVYWREE